VLKKQIGDTIHEIELNCDEVRAVYNFYAQYLIDETIWNKLQADYGLTDFSKCEDLMDNISYRYNKILEWGGDPEFSFDEAISENKEQIEKLVKQQEGAKR